VLEANPRASRTVPLVSKICNIQMAPLATELMMGKKLTDLKPSTANVPFYGVKESVFPFDKMPEVDPVLGPEMRSTGEVLGLADSFGSAFCKAQEAAGGPLPLEGTVLLSLAEKTPQALQIAQSFVLSGFRIKATEGTHRFLRENGVECERINKEHEGRPTITDGIMNREIQLVINTPIGKRGQQDDSYIRKTAIRHKIPYMTTLAAALASAHGIREARKGRAGVRTLQDYHAQLR
jgi:carbamoyl-phosphate synthase large subunit